MFHAHRHAFKKNKGCHKILELYRDIFQERCIEGWDSGMEGPTGRANVDKHLASVQALIAHNKHVSAKGMSAKGKCIYL